MRRNHNSVFPGFNPLFLEGDGVAGGKQLNSQELALLVKRCGSFLAGTFLLLLLLVFLPVSLGEEKERTVARNPRSDVYGRYATGNVTFSPKGRNLIWNCGGVMHTRVVATDEELLPVTWKEAWFAGLSPDGSIAVLEGQEENKDKEAIAAIEKMKGIPEADKAKAIEALGMMKAGDWFMALWKMKTSERLAILKSYRPMTDGVSGNAVFSPDGKNVVVTAGSPKGGDTGWNKLTFWEIPSGKLRHVLDFGKKPFPNAVQFSPDGKTLAAGGLARNQEYGKRESILDLPSLLKLWDVATGKCLAEYKGMKGPIYSVAFSPDGKLLAVGGNIGNQINEIIVWDVAKKERRATLTGHREPVAALAFSHDGKLLASAGGGPRDGELRLWDVKTFREFRNLRGHTQKLTSIAFSPNDRLLASGSMDGTVRLWHLYESAKAKGEVE